METQRIEYKDFSFCENTKNSIKKVKSKLFKEICAFANSDGGQILVGIDDVTLKKVKQPKHILTVLSNESLSQWVNDVSNGLIVLRSSVKDSIVCIDIEIAVDIIQASKNLGSLIKVNNVFHRVNSASVLAQPKDIEYIIGKKRRIVIGDRERKLRDIVHYKFKCKLNNTSDLNIFDSLFITLSSRKECLFEEAKYLFDVIITNEFTMNYNLPHAKEYKVMYHNMIMTKLVKNGNAGNKTLIDLYQKHPYMQRDLFKSSRDMILNSIELDQYIVHFNTSIKNEMKNQ